MNYTWADKVEQVDNVIKQRKNKKTTKKRKMSINNPNTELFVSGLQFQDIEQLNAKTAVRMRLRDERRAKFVSMWDRFGEVLEVRTHWTKGFLFVVYKEEEVVRRVANLLLQHEERVKLTKDMESEHAACGLSRKSAPRPTYYVRLPKSLPTDIPQDPSSCFNSIPVCTSVSSVGDTKTVMDTILSINVQ